MEIIEAIKYLESCRGVVGATCELESESIGIVEDPIATGMNGRQCIMDLGGREIKIKVTLPNKTVFEALHELYGDDQLIVNEYKRLHTLIAELLVQNKTENFSPEQLLRKWDLIRCIPNGITDRKIWNARTS